MNIKKKAAAFAIAILMAVSPLQQSLYVSADEVPKDTESPLEDVLPEESKDDTEEPEITEEEKEQEETVITEEQKSNIVTAYSSEEYFKLIADFPECERVIVDTYEDLSDLDVTYGVYFDGTYILGFDSGEDLVKAVGKLSDMNCEYALDGTVSVCGSMGGYFSFGSINPDAKVKVAVIDTGSDLANESYSVIGDDTSDYNGHGTSMCDCVLSETGNAYIISIKALGDDGKGNMSDVYTAVQLAEDIGVDYILMAVSIRNTGRYDAFISLIGQTNAIVVAAAGNNGTDASKYLPAGIPGVITVGALNEDRTIRSSSNYGGSVDYYLTAESTSEAASTALGIIIDGRSDTLLTEPLEVSDGSDGEYYLSMRADDDDVRFYTDSVGDQSICVYATDHWPANSLFRSGGPNHLGFYSDQNAGSAVFDSHLLYCSQDELDGPTGYNYGRDGNVNIRLVQTACAFGPSGDLYDYAVAWWNENDPDGEVLNKTNSTSMKKAIYSITHYICCKAYRSDNLWPASTPDDLYPLMNSYVSYIQGIRDSGTIDGFTLSGWWAEEYSCQHFSSAEENENFQIVVRGGVSKTTTPTPTPPTTTTSTDISITIDKSSSSTTDAGYLGFAGAKYTLYASCVLTIQDGSLKLDNEKTVFTMKADGSADKTFRASFEGIAAVYYLKETQAAPGYSLDENVYMIVIANNGSSAVYVAEVHDPGSAFAYIEWITDAGRISVTGSTVHIVHVKDAPDKALFSLNKKLGANYTAVAGQTYNFELWDNTSNTLVATGTATVPATATSSSSTPVVWANIANGYSASTGNKLILIAGHSYQVMETTMSVNGNSLDTPSGWTKGTAHGKSCFYQTFSTSAGKVYSYAVTNNVSVISLNISKTSSVPGVTGNNVCYSLANTSYGLYASQSDAEAKKNVLVTFTLDASGNTNTKYTTSFGKTYYLKEISAGKGYKLDTKTYTVTVASDGTVSVNNGASVTTSNNISRISLKDEPGSALLDINLKKVDKPGNIIHNAALTGAVFRISYYAQDLGASGNNNAAATVIYNVMLSGSSAVIKLSDLKALTPAGGSNPNYFKNLPSDWKDFPYGTIRIQEITAPAGYRLNDQAVRYRLGETISFSVENNSTYGNRNYWRQLADGTIELTELPKVGYYSLTKTLDDKTIRSNLEGFEYELYNMSSKSSPVLIATGVSQSDGHVLWTYKVQDYYQNSDPSKLLTGTTTYQLELPAIEKDSAGAETAIRYQVREITDSIYIAYGDSGIPYTYAAPVTSGKAWTKANGYYYKDVSVTDETVAKEEVTNDYLYTGISANKVVPANNPFDVTKVSFKVYNTDSGKDILVANGIVDSNGNVTWHRAISSGCGSSPSSSVNVLNNIPLGSYRVEETWNKDYVDANGTLLLIVEKNNNGWTKTETDAAYTYSLDVDLTSEANDGQIKTLSVENEREVQEFNLTKNVVVEDDASDVAAELYLLDGENEILVATGSCRTSGVGTYGFIWDYSGTHMQRDGLDTLVLPVGKYRVIEICPETFYKDTTVPYSYMTPEGFISRIVGGKLQFYKDFELLRGDYATENITITNVRIEGSFDIIKVERSGGDEEETFDLEIYYRGNGDEASDDKTLLDTASITTSDGKGSVSLSKIPEGWYEICETDAGPSWRAHWINEATVANGNKIIRLDSGGRTSAVLTVDDEVKEDGNPVNAVVIYNDVAPVIGTTLVDITTGEHVSVCSSETVLEDTVSYEHLLPGHYVLTGVLMDKKTGKEIVDIKGRPITASAEFDVDEIPDEYGEAMPQSGTVKITYKLDTTSVNDVTVVAFEELHKDSAEGELIASHKDINDESQTVFSPGLKTTLIDLETDSHVASCSETTKLVDTVRYTNLLVGKEYTVSGVLVNKETGDVITGEDGNEITASTVFTAESSEGSVDIVFEFSAGFLNGTTVVAFEDLLYSDILVATHSDINDEDQTVYFPQIHTTLLDAVTDSHIAGQGNIIKLVDKVAYTNLKPGYVYTLSGKLMDRETGEEFLNKDGNAITSEVEFTPDSDSGSVDIIFEFDGDLIAGDTLVAFEECRYGDKIVATHNDITDIEQTVDIPDIRTAFFDKEAGEGKGFVRIGTEEKLIDRVYYKKLIPGLEYTLYGSVFVKETKEALKDEKGNEVVNTVTFIPETSEGFIDVEFTINTELLEGQTLVAFETLDYNNISLVIHADIGDVDQTVHVPNIMTTATDADNKSHTLTYKERVTIVDRVFYDNLIEGRTYIVEGTLYNAETGGIYKDINGRTYKESLEFTASGSSGFADVVFKDVLVPYEKTKMVVFENLSDKETGLRITTHADITDEGQTVERPTAMTSASVDGSKEIWLASTEAVNVTITDTIFYSGFEPGNTYLAEATLYKSDGTQLMNGDTPVTGYVMFVPGESDDTVDVNITFSTAGLSEGDRIVVFERIYDVATKLEITEGTQNKDILIAKHEDINYEGQTVTVHFSPKTGGITPSYTVAGSIIASAASIAVGAWFIISRKRRFGGK